MKQQYIATMHLALDVSGEDKGDVYESLHALADALNDADFEGLRHLTQFRRIRAQFVHTNIQQVVKATHEPPLPSVRSDGRPPLEDISSPGTAVIGENS